MGDTKDNDAYEEELLDYEEEEEKAPDSVNAKTNGESGKKWVFLENVLTFVDRSLSTCNPRVSISGLIYQLDSFKVFFY